MNARVLVCASFLVLGLPALAGCVLEAESKCDAFITAYCEKEVDDCKQRTLDKCLEAARNRFDCTKAEAAPMNADQCPADIKAKACPVSLNALPPSCNFEIKM